jgi:hypothetical protein
MGLVRKTFSVATLGVVSFRSKKEKLRRAERSRCDAERDLERERSARETAERRIAAAEERVKHATGEASRAARRLEKVKKKEKAERGRRRRRALGGMLAAAEPSVRSGTHAARDASVDAGRAGRRAGRRARKAASRAARGAQKQAQRSLKRAAKSTKDVVTPVADRITERVGEAFDQVSGH